MGERTRGAVLALVGGSGGVGTSVLAVAVAVRARWAGVEAVLVDAAPLGGGLDVTLGAEQETGIRWPDLGGLVGAADGRALLSRLPAVDGVPVLSFDRVEAHPSATPPPRSWMPWPPSATLSSSTSPCCTVPSRRPGSTPRRRWSSWRVKGCASWPPCPSRWPTCARVRQRRSSPNRGMPARSPRALAPLARLVESEMGVPVAFTLDDDAGVRADLVHGIAPGSRGGGAVVATADEVLGWAVLPRGRAGDVA